jgi:hypothetical protein
VEKLGFLRGASPVEYRLSAAQTGASVRSESLRAKAGEDGQDVITPLLEQEASAVLDLIRKKAALHE